MAGIQDILGWRNISRSVQMVETGIPDNLPPEFNSITEDVLGDRTTYIEFFGQRQAARQSQYGAPSRPRAQRPIGEKSVALLHFPEHIKIEQELLLQLRQSNDLIAQKKAEEIVRKAGMEFRQAFDNARIVTQVSMLANGNIWLDNAGNLLASATGASLTIPYGIPATNTGQLNGIIDISWANPASDIVQQMENLRIQMRRNTGHVLTHAFYGANIANYLWTNNTLKGYFQFNPAIYQAFAKSPGIIPDGMLGIAKWTRMGDTFFAATNDAPTDQVVPLWGANLVTFTPKIDSNIYTLYQGSILAPRKIGVAPTLDAALSDAEIVYGMGGYSVVESDPICVKSIFFDTQFPHWKQPLDMFQATVAF